MDQYGNQLNTYNYTPDVASVDFNQPLNAGDSIWYTITTNVAGMIYNDTTNPGNYGMQFIPQWISDTAINDVRVQIVLPSGVQVSDVKTTENFYNGTSTVDGRVGGLLGKTIHWRRTSSLPSASLSQHSTCQTIPHSHAAQAAALTQFSNLIACSRRFRGYLHLHIHRLPRKQEQLLNAQSQHGNSWASNGA